MNTVEQHISAVLGPVKGIAEDGNKLCFYKWLAAASRNENPTSIYFKKLTFYSQELTTQRPLFTE